MARAARRPLLPEPRRHLRIAPRAAAAPRRAADRRARRAARQPATTAPVVVVSAVALSEKVPDPALRPHGFVAADRRAARSRRDRADLVAAGYERVDQVEDRGQFAIRGGLLDVFRRPRTAPSASTCSAMRSSRCAGSRPSRSARSATPSVVEIAPAAELAEEHRELAEIAALEEEADRPDIASCCRSRTSTRSSSSSRADAAILIAGEEDVAPALADHWQDVTRGVPRRGCPSPLRRARRRSSAALDGPRPDPALEHRPGPAVRVPRADRRHRGPRRQGGRARAREARRARGYRTVVAFARRGEGERAAYNLGRLKVALARSGRHRAGDGRSRHR